MPAPKKKILTIKLPAAKPVPKAKSATRRLTLELDPQLYDDLATLASEQRRELKQQAIVILEAAVKAAAGRKRTQARKQRLKDLYGG